MKKWTLHIIMLLLVSTWVSCTSEQDDTLDASKDDVKISFILSMGVPATSRALSTTEDAGNAYENTIDVNHSKVLFYTSEGKLWGEVKQLTFVPLSGTTYQIIGALSPESGITVDKLENPQVVVLANCGEAFTGDFNSVYNLAYNYNSADFNPSAPKKYIPLAGVKKFSETLTFTPGSRTELGTIDLHRAMAKVIVNFTPSECSQARVTGISLDKAHKQGYCAAQTVDVPNVPAADGTQEVAFIQTIDGNNQSQYVIYIPEMSQEEAKNSKINVSFVDKTYELYFKDYTSTDADPFFPVLRNYVYTYNTTLIEGRDLEVEMKVKEWEKSTEFVSFTKIVGYTKMLWDGYKEKMDNEIYLNYRQAVKCSFSIKSPEGARWYVALSNSNVFKFTDGDTTSGIIESAGESDKNSHTIHIEPKIWDITGTYQTAVRVYVTLPAGNTVELDMTVDSDSPAFGTTPFKVIYSR